MGKPSKRADFPINLPSCVHASSPAAAGKPVLILAHIQYSFGPLPCAYTGGNRLSDKLVDKGGY